MGATQTESTTQKPRLVHKNDYHKAQDVLHFHRTGRRLVGGDTGRQLIGEPLFEVPMTDDEAILLASQGVTIQGEWL